ncbi:MAG: Trans-hexaprenyltranstransferase [Acidobacteriales bacterium]|nr:Trans-hexaprenyltranstransferase [Terriglobales bacterium]
MSTATTFTVKEVFDLLRDDLAAIETEFERGTVSRVSAITDIGSYLRGGGGKRIRPALLLLSSKLMGYTGDGAVKLGAVVEIVHTATLVHDDIIDEAEIRRGRPSANTNWGNARCVLAGDWLYMQAFRIALQERKLKVLDVLIDLTQQMVEGELLQMEKLGKCVGLKEHFDLIFRKTACLFATSMRLGGILGNATEDQERCLEDYGRNLGMAFQIVDDVLDLTASEEVLGKPVASDLREGKVTMAVIHALERCTPEERKLVETVLAERAFKSVSHKQILEMLHRYGSIDAANTAAAEYSEAAREAISNFPDSEIKRALLWVPDFVVEREK